MLGAAVRGVQHAWVAPVVSPQQHSTRGLRTSQQRRGPNSATNMDVTMTSPPSQAAGGRCSPAITPSSAANTGSMVITTAAAAAVSALCDQACTTNPRQVAPRARYSSDTQAQADVVGGSAGVPATPAASQHSAAATATDQAVMAYAFSRVAH